MIRKPLVLIGGEPTQLPDGDRTTDGLLVQSFFGNIGQSSGTTRIPYDNTPPLNTEGTELFSQVVTPTAIGNNIEIEFSTIIDTSAINLTVTLAVFKDGNLIGYASSAASAYNGAIPTSLSLKINDTVTALTASTYSCRIGISANGTWYVSRGNSGTMGGVNKSGWSIKEYNT